MRVERIVGEAAVIHGLIRRAERRDYVADLLTKVGLNPDVLSRYPTSFPAVSASASASRARWPFSPG